MTNPDGYEHTWRGDDTRKWRKNLTPSTMIGINRVCRGVDLNRNFDSQWATAGEIL